MVFEDLLEVVGDTPVFESSLLLAGDVRPSDVQRQLSRWTRDGKVVQLRRGLYALASPYRRVVAEPFLIANRLHAPSYVSCVSALAFHGLLPEAVPLTVSITTRRTVSYDTRLGGYRYHHIHGAYFFGYESASLAADQSAFVATPEKALLDLVYFQPGGDRPQYLESLRLQNLETLDTARLQELAGRAGTPKLRRAVERIVALANAESREYTIL